MKITNINGHQNFKSLRINYDAQTKLMHTNASHISFLFEAGRKLEGTQFVDLFVSSDLKCKIQSKANPYFAIKEPIVPSLVNSKQIKLNGVYAGKENQEQGKFIDLYLDYDKEEVTQTVFNRLLKEPKGIQRLSYITRLIDNDLVKKNSNPDNANPSRHHIVSILLDKYGDFAK